MKHFDWVRNEINKLLDTQVIHSSHSSWSAPIIVVPKEDDGEAVFSGELEPITISRSTLALILTLGLDCWRKHILKLLA